MTFRLSTLLVGITLLAACGANESPDPTQATEDPAADETSELIENPEGVVELRDLVAGDLGCYATFGTPDGTGVIEELAAFDVCEQEDLIGRQVSRTYETVNVPAASCEGDPECTDTEAVQVVMELTPVD
ncbi:hypothetical protein BH23BAC4_BH23BAC4_08340 [soil metagenome]